jgi:gliding motility-associated-like protein
VKFKLLCMKNNYLHKIEIGPISILINNRRPASLFGLIFGFFGCQNAQAQLVNQTDLKVDNEVVMAIYMDYKNEASGNLINNGKIYVFQNWLNDGIVSYNDSGSGTTFFSGSKEQFIEGASVSNFKNLVFDNLAELTPFHLKTTIAVGNNLDFKNGIINAIDYKGKVIFNEKAAHTNVGNQSFVDGVVEKKGDESFEFPVGNELYFRPTYHAANSSLANAYDTQYFYQNSNELHSHINKVEEILAINDKEYWNVTQEKGDEDIVLSLTLDEKTTPPAFFNTGEDTQLVIVRWDEKQAKWVSDGGDVSDPNASADYLKLLTAKVGGYGIFTMGLIKKTPPVAEDVIVYNAISPNDDGLNDSFMIEGIANFPDNQVEIYNRWGVKVYEAKSYNETDVMFRGYSDGRATVKRGEKLPTGTYFYILKYNTGKRVKERTGYLYINNQ